MALHRPSALLIVATLAAAPGAAARTWLVNPAGTGDAPTVQAAVDSTSPGDVVLLAPGTYGEEITLVSDITLTTQGGAEVTSIDAQSVRAHCLESAGSISGVTIKGLTLTGVNSGYGFCTGRSGVSLTGGFAMDDCIVESNFCGENRAAVEFDGTGIFVECTFRDNGAGYDCGAYDPGGRAGAIWGGPLAFIAGCVFEDNFGSSNAVIMITSGSMSITACTFRGNRTLYAQGLIGMSGFGTSVELTDNLFVDNEGPLFPDASYPPSVVDMSGNTVARNVDFFHWAVPALAPGSILERNVFTGSVVGLAVPGGGAGITIECNDSFGNGTNWSGFTPGPGNFSLSPLYCHPAADDFRVSAESPLLAPNNPCAAQIGAFGEGCGPIALEASSWAEIKARYR